MKPESSPTLVEPPSWLVSREQYHAMAEAGIFKPSDKVELIRGRIVTMMPLGPWHNSATELIQDALRDAYGKKFHIRSPGALGLGNDSEPEPDIAVLKRREDYYRAGHPQPADVVLIIEVADSSRAYDLGTKQDLYAEHGIPEYWVVDGKRQCVHVFRIPENGAFQETKVYRLGETIALPEGDGVVLPLSKMGL